MWWGAILWGKGPTPVCGNIGNMGEYNHDGDSIPELSFFQILYIFKVYFWSLFGIQGKMHLKNQFLQLHEKYDLNEEIVFKMDGRGWWEGNWSYWCQEMHIGGGMSPGTLHDRNPTMNSLVKIYLPVTQFKKKKKEPKSKNQKWVVFPRKKFFTPCLPILFS